jgi:hypothetical protein
MRWRIRRYHFLLFGKSTFGKIYYWYHEGDIGADIYLISNTFFEFIQGLQKQKAEVAERNFVKRTFIAPKMLE